MRAAAAARISLTSKTIPALLSLVEDDDEEPALRIAAANKLASLTKYVRSGGPAKTFQDALNGNKAIPRLLEALQRQCQWEVHNRDVVAPRDTVEYMARRSAAGKALFSCSERLATRTQLKLYAPCLNSARQRKASARIMGFWRYFTLSCVLSRSVIGAASAGPFTSYPSAVRTLVTPKMRSGRNWFRSCLIAEDWTSSSLLGVSTEVSAVYGARLGSCRTLSR